MRASAENVFPGPFRKFEKLLWEWTWLNREMAKSWKWKDCPWWYNERASISTLAGAVWNAGGTALEEYSSKKRTGGRSTNGRCDLYFRIGRDEYVTEAKLCWLSAGRQARYMERNVRSWLDVACKDAKRTDSELQGGETILGILFVVPCIPIKSEEDFLGERIKKVQEALIDIARKEKCALAWIFPRDARKMTYRGAESIFPGTAVLIKRVQV